MTRSIGKLVEEYKQSHKALLAFNIPHLPMVEAVARAVSDQGKEAIIQVARIEWTKFQAESPEAVAKEFYRHVGGGGAANGAGLYLHLDHIPALDEDDRRVDYLSLIARGIDAGFSSVMIDASRLPLEENTRITAEVTELAHRNDIPVEGEIGAVFGHEAEPPRDYEELFASKKGFTGPEEAEAYARGSQCDWLSVSFGSIHGFVAAHLRNQDKPAARLDIKHLLKIRELVELPLVLHGGSGVAKENIMQAVQHGIAKINIGNAIRLAYERGGGSRGEVEKGQEACYAKVRELLSEFATADEIDQRRGASE